MKELVTNIGSGITVKAKLTQLFRPGQNYFQAFIITAEYLEYQESDPIYQLLLAPPSRDAEFGPIDVEFTLELNSEEIDKRITAFFIYQANAIPEIKDITDWKRPFEEFYLMEEIRIANIHSGLKKPVLNSVSHQAGFSDSITRNIIAVQQSESKVEGAGFSDTITREVIPKP